MTNPFKDRFYLGQKIQYLGIEMLVTRLTDPYDSDINPVAMVVHYRDKKGILQVHAFEDQDLDALLLEAKNFY